jgi:hypothetical protein
MKFIFILIIATINLQLLAQKIKLEQNKLFVNNEYWGSLSEKWSNSGHNSLTFNGVDGKKWMEANFVKIKTDDTTLSLYKISFYPQNRIVYYNEGMELKQSLCTQLVKSGAFTKTGTYDRGIDKFERNFGLDLNEQKYTVKIPNGKYKVTLVERDKNAVVFVTNGQIKQDFKLIGTYNKEIISRNDSIICQITFLDIKGVEIAKANFEDVNAETAILNIHNYKDTIIINLNKGNNNMKVEEIAKQLIYLGKM